MSDRRDDIKNDGRKLINDLHGAANEAKDTLRDKFRHVSEAVSEKARYVGEEAYEKAKHLRDNIQGAEESVAKYTKQKPLTAIAIALAAGFVVGKIFRK